MAEKVKYINDQTVLVVGNASGYMRQERKAIMKRMKKLLAVVLAVTVALTMGIAGSAMVFAADETYSITVNNSTNTSSSIQGKEYKAYKVFDVTLGNKGNDGKYGAYAYSISNTDWAWTTLTKDATTDSKGVITTKYGIKLTPSASNAAKYSVDQGTFTEAKARTLADDLAKAGLPSSDDGHATGGAQQTATITVGGPGYYAVYGVVVPKDPKGTEEVVAALALTTTDPQAEVIPKAEVPPLDKKITGEHILDTAGKAATAEVGKTVFFQLDSKVPDLTGYSDYTFTITDTMSAGLTFTTPSDVVVKVNNANKTSDATIDVDGQKLTITIPYAKLKDYTKGQKIVVTYSAVVNSNALTTDYEKNTANLTYSNNPTTNTTNKTPDKEVYVIDVDINVDKVANSASGAKLDKAKFIVFKGSAQPADTAEAWYKWDSTNNKVTWVAKKDADTFETNTEGKFNPSVRGLEAEATGTAYGLLETEAPEGYNLLDAPVIVTLTGAYADNSGTKTATVTADGATVTKGTVTLSADQTADQPLATAQVINQSGSVLPSTGGIGTIIFYILGALLVIVSGIVLIARRRLSANN